MTHAGSRIAVTLLFALIYLAFLFETGVLVYEFGPDGLALQMATMFAHNFLFFPVAGALALIAFWRPAVLIVDALAAGRVPHGRITLIAVAGIIGFLSWSLSNAFAGSNTRSLFEVAPDAIVSDEGVPSEDPALRRAAIGEVLIQMKINAASEGGLQRFQSRCEDEWLRYGVAAQEQRLEHAVLPQRGPQRGHVDYRIVAQVELLQHKVEPEHAAEWGQVGHAVVHHVQLDRGRVAGQCLAQGRPVRVVDLLAVEIHALDAAGRDVV